MAAIGYAGPFEEEPSKSPLWVLSLSALMTVILSGALYILPLIHRSSTWIVWACIAFVIFLSARELPLGHLLLPFMPYLLWLCFYLVWGLIVSPVTDIAFVSKTLVTTLVLTICMAVLTAKPQYLRTFANCAQFGVVANLLVWVLIPWSSYIGTLVMKLAGQVDPDYSSFTRYGGLVGNPNMLGYICLITTIVSVLAVPWVAWIGRLSCLPLLYLSASRKSSLLYLVILLLYVIVVQRRNVKFWAATGILVVSSTLFLMLSNGLKAKSQSVTENPVVARLMDLQEKDTSQSGDVTRVDLLQDWLAVLREEPWYGYGLQAMAGTIYVEDHPDMVLVRGPYPLGTHNTYLGVWVDIGPVGFIAFLLVMLHYARVCLFTEGVPITRWVMVSFMVVNLTFLFVSHNHLFDFVGMASFALFFLLPSSLGLQELGQSLGLNSEW